MKLGIMQPYLFPYIGYFQLMNAVDMYVIYDDVQFIKGGWINRNNILIGDQKVLFAIPLRGASANKKINEIEVESDLSKFLKTTSMAYSRAPYHEPVSGLLQSICAYDDHNLANFTGNSLQLIANYLGITTTFIYSSTLTKDTQLKGQDKVLAISKELGADTYLNAIGGQELYSKDDFAAQGITLQFLQSRPVAYNQHKGEFIPSLSIIDVMMFNSPTEITTMLEAYELI